VRAISYRGKLVALATRRAVYLAPEISMLPFGDPKLRFVAALCLYSHDVDEGEVAGPYRPEEAELYARCVLLPDDEFEVFSDEPDGQLAKRFRVPLEQVSAKRGDLAREIGARANGPVA
jgi:hypothetical protein